MSSEKFDFKQFSVRHSRCAMKVGTDGVLLGAWAQPLFSPDGRGGVNILDIGTGSGLIALMLAQRFPEAIVDAIDVDPSACGQADENVLLSPYSNRINVFEVAFQNYHSDSSYDLIVSNPPYFVDSLKNPDKRRCIARHADALPFKDLFQGAARLLKDNGTFSVILPVDILEQVFAEASISGFFVNCRVDIKTTHRHAAKRSLLAFCKHPADEVFFSVECLQKTDGSRSEWYVNLCDNFYL